VRSAKIAAFEERRRARVGTFIDSARITRTNPGAVSDLMRFAASMAVVPVVDRRTGQIVYRLRVRGGGVCLPTVYVDGFPVPLVSDLREMDTFVRPPDVGALEMYTAGQAPAEFTGGNRCAYVVITTKW
jgi:hypothetical protein